MIEWDEEKEKKKIFSGFFLLNALFVSVLKIFFNKLNVVSVFYDETNNKQKQII